MNSNSNRDNSYNMGYNNDIDQYSVNNEALTQKPATLNTSSISFDMLNVNAQMVNTRYDNKSVCASSLYGSKKSVAGTVSFDTRGGHAPVVLPRTRRQRMKDYVMKKIFSDDTSYSLGEYQKDADGNIISSSVKLNGGPEDRENWSGRCDFFMSCLGYAVGLGAVWRFPYLCYRNGGGVFLIPYFIFLILVGIPIFYLELNIGQFTSQGPINCWKMAPIFKGLGISMTITSFYLAIYYNMIIAYSLYFLFYSFQSPLPWSKCNPILQSMNCTDDFDNFIIRCDQADVYRDPNGLCYSYSSDSRQSIGWWNREKRLEFKKPVLPSQDFFNINILAKSNGLENSEPLVWQLVLCLFFAWLIIFLCLFKGIKSSGKVVYFTALFPFLVLFILGIAGWTLEGSGKGIEFYIKPDWSKLLEINVWFDAAVQIFFAMSTACGGLITLASYNRFNQNTLRDTFVITLTNALTAVFAGFVVFAYIGNLAFVTQQEVKDVVSSGSGLAFIVFPYAVTKLPFPPFWSLLFFVMMLTLGLDSEFATVETISTVIMDSIPSLRKHKSVIIGVLCTVMFLLGLPLCTQGGQYWIELMDKHSGGWALLLIGAIECIAVGWVYGHSKFAKDINLMIGKQCNNPIFYWYFRICWKFISPILLVFLVIVYWIQYEPLQSDGYVFPFYANLIGWIITVSVMFGFIGWIIYCLIKVFVFEKQTFASLFKPEEDWGPLRMEHKRIAVHLENLEPYHDSKRAKKMDISAVNLNNYERENYYR